MEQREFARAPSWPGQRVDCGQRHVRRSVRVSPCPGKCLAGGEAVQRRNPRRHGGDQLREICSGVVPYAQPARRRLSALATHGPATGAKFQSKPSSAQPPRRDHARATHSDVLGGAAAGGAGQPAFGGTTRGSRRADVHPRSSAEEQPDAAGERAQCAILARRGPRGVAEVAAEPRLTPAAGTARSRAPGAGVKPSGGSPTPCVGAMPR